jgi:hypothetical protein
MPCRPGGCPWAISNTNSTSSEMMMPSATKSFIISRCIVAPPGSPDCIRILPLPGSIRLPDERLPKGIVKKMSSDGPPKNAGKKTAEEEAAPASLDPPAGDGQES